MNFIKVEDNLLTKKECTDLIEWVCKNNKMIPHEHKHNWSGYDYHDLMHVGQNYDECFSTIPLRPAYHAINTLKDSYVKSFPEVERISRWGIQYVRLKRWTRNNYYSAWHSEHMPDWSGRVMSFLIYLTDNNAYTEFRRHRNVRTKAGRGIMFPAYYTHEHRGSICKDGLDRYIISGYYGFN